MDSDISVQPLPYKRRQSAFLALLLVFIVSMPFLYMYATGYRIDIQREASIVSTGGMYIGVGLTGAEIYIDDELMRETRTFRRAFYAQGLDAGTHRVHVQKEGFHTWVKELPVSKRLVTEADAFNLPLVPQVRVIAPFQTATGTQVVAQILTHASSTNELLATTTVKTNQFVLNEEYIARRAYFATTTATATPKEVQATSSEEVVATTTLMSSGVKLHEAEGGVYASWVGSFEQMPYYYCATDFPRYGTSTIDTVVEEEVDSEDEIVDDMVMHPVQTVPEDTACEPTIRIDTLGQSVLDFDFYPSSTDQVLMLLERGLYMIEVDDRSWQNAQLVFSGENLEFHIDGGSIYVFDGELIYQVIIPIE